MPVHKKFSAVTAGDRPTADNYHAHEVAWLEGFYRKARQGVSNPRFGTTRDRNFLTGCTIIIAKRSIRLVAVAACLA